MGTKRTPQMLKNCSAILLEEIKILKPHVIIAQGGDAKKVASRVLNLSKDSFLCSVRHKKDHSEFYISGNMLVVLTRHPTRSGNKKTKEELAPIFIKTAEKIRVLLVNKGQGG